MSMKWIMQNIVQIACHRQVSQAEAEILEFQTRVQLWLQRIHQGITDNR
jgi:hypothetical protein